MRSESYFQADLIREIRRRFPFCVVLKTDPTYIQGFPDLLVLYKGRWAALECKRSRDAVHQTNQDYYIQRLSDIGGYAAFIFPENKEEVLNELQQAFESGWPTCFPES